MVGSVGSRNGGDEEEDVEEQVAGQEEGSHKICRKERSESGPRFISKILSNKASHNEFTRRTTK